MTDEPIPAPAEQAAPEDEKWPIGFILTIAMVALYLGWRLVQLVAWAFDALF